MCVAMCGGALSNTQSEALNVVFQLAVMTALRLREVIKINTVKLLITTSEHGFPITMVRRFDSLEIYRRRSKL